MPRNGSGTSSVINTFVIDTIADPDEVNANFDDVADQLTNSLPRDGQAGMNAPLPLDNGTGALPALTFTSDPDTGIYRASANKLGLALGGVGYPLDAGVVYAAKAGNYTAVVGDNNAVHRYTATATVALTAAATLAANWHYTVVADGAAVTIDPNASETINGAATLILQSGQSASIICDGTNFFTVTRPTAWETVGLFTLSAASSLIVTDQSESRFIRISGFISQSALGIPFIQVSANNGSSYDTAANYFAQSIAAVATTVSAQNQAATTGLLLTDAFGSDAGSNTPIDCKLFEFNKVAQTTGFSESVGLASANRKHAKVGIFHTVAAAQNAFRISNSGGGTLTGTLLVERMRG